MLGTPPAFVLSQDQTLKKLYLNSIRSSNHFLNNLLLAILLKNFRWLKIRLHDILNNSSIVQGVIVCLYVIQFTRYRRRRSRGQLLHSIILISICQVLFSSSSKFLRVFRLPVARSDPFILAQPFSFVKNFFQVFSNFFRFCSFSLPSRTACVY